MSLEIDQLVAQAWSDADAMQVLVDYLLEKGEITQMTEEDARYVSAWHLPPNASWSDDALFRLEVQAREWILNRLLERLGKLELRITGGWPDFFYVVHRLDKPKGRYDSSNRSEVFGVTKQPRLLRTERVRAAGRAREAGESEAEVLGMPNAVPPEEP